MRIIRGFSLIELVITVALLAILVSLAWPAYERHVKRARRADAFAAMQEFAAAMERYYTVNGSYTGAANNNADTGSPSVPGTFRSAKLPLDSGEEYYRLSIQSATSATFILRATPVNSQAGDGIIEITHTGRKGWDENGDGDTADAGEADWKK